MDQLCATLRAPPSSGGTTGAAQTGPVSDALLLALRGLSLGGGSIGAEEASNFRKVRCRLYSMCVRREGRRDGDQKPSYVFYLLFLPLS